MMPEPPGRVGRIVRSEGFSYPEMVTAIERTGRRIVGLVRSLELQDGGKPVPGLEWTVAQTAAHLLGIVMRGTGDRRRAATVEKLGDLNMIQITEIADEDPSGIADKLEALLNRQLSQLPRATGDEPFELHAGLFASIKTALSYELWDFLIHGHDIARATGRGWTIDPSDAALDVLAIIPALEPWLRQEIRSGATKLLRFTFPQLGQAIVVQVGNGRYHVGLEEDNTARELDPVETLLVLAQREKSRDEVISELSSWYLPT